MGQRGARRAALAAALLSLAGCASSEPEATARPTVEELRARIREDSLDPWPHYGLARLHEEAGRYEQAILAYGECINRLPPRSATRPVLDLGVLHHRLGHVAPAERCYREVLETIASDRQSYRENDDFKVAALGLKVVLQARGDEAELAALQRRFHEELGGDPGQWTRGPLWLTPLSPPAPTTPSGQ